MPEEESSPPTLAADASAPLRDQATLERIPGVDLARAVALIGMMAVHVGPSRAGGLAASPFTLWHGRASVLFVLVAGVGVSMLARSRARSGMEVRWRLFWRAAILLPFGLLLQGLNHGVLVILQTYALLFFVGASVTGLPGRRLLALAAMSGILGPLVFLRGQIEEPTVFNRAAVSAGDSFGHITHGLLLSGPYPLIVWAAPFLIGMWIGRRDLRSPAVRRALLVTGACVAACAFTLAQSLQLAIRRWPDGFEWSAVPEAVFDGFTGASPWAARLTGWEKLADASPHSQAPLWLIGATAAAVLLLGAALSVGDRMRGWTWPFVRLGQLSLTVYVAHLLALHWWKPALTSHDPGEAGLILLGMTGAAVVFSAAWRAVFARGPLEILLSPPKWDQPRVKDPG